MLFLRPDGCDQCSPCCHPALPCIFTAVILKRLGR
jgi:hypothetical protein